MQTSYPALLTFRLTDLTLSKCKQSRNLQNVLQNQLQRSSESAPTVNAALVGPTLIGQRCWVRWPYLQEAIVEGVSDSTEKVCDSTTAFVQHRMPWLSNCG